MKYNKVIYGLFFFVSITFGLLIAAFRGDIFNQVLTLNVILRAAPSSFWFFGALMLIPIISKNPSWKNLTQSTCLMTVVAIAMEIEQYITSRTFDIIDLLAILFASTTFLMLHKNRKQKKTSIDQR